MPEGVEKPPVVTIEQALKYAQSAPGDTLLAIVSPRQAKHLHDAIMLLKECPFGVHQGKLITYRSTNEGDLVTWVEKIYAWKDYKP